MSTLLRQAFQDNTDNLSTENLNEEVETIDVSGATAVLEDIYSLESLREDYHLVNKFLVESENDMSTEAESVYKDLISVKMGVSVEDLTLEEIRGFSTRLLQTIKNTGTRIRGGLKRLFTSELRTARGLQEMATRLSRELELFNDSDRKNDHIKVDGGRYMHFNGDVSTDIIVSNAPDAAKFLTDILEKTLEYGNKYLVAGIEGLTIHLERSRSGKPFDVEALNAIQRPYKDYLAYVDDLKKYSGKTLPGGYIVKGQTSGNMQARDRSTNDTADMYYLSAISKTRIGSYKNATDVVAPTKDQMFEVLTAAEQLLSVYTRSENDFKELIDRTQDLDSIGNHVLKVMEEKDIEVYEGTDHEGNVYVSKQSVVDDASDPFSFMVNYLEPVVSYIAQYGVSPARSYLKFVEAGINNK